MSNEHINELNRAIAKAAYHMNHIPGINGIRLTRKGKGASQQQKQQELSRAQQIAKILYDSEDMKNNTNDQS